MLSFPFGGQGVVWDNSESSDTTPFGNPITGTCGLICVVGGRTFIPHHLIICISHNDIENTTSAATH
jgi:hypothetical protein